jgi:hypothetical protein
VTSESSAASAGGAAGASGVGYQDLVFAWLASCLIVEEPLQVPLAVGTVIQVGAQTGYAVDDVAVLTDAGNAVLVQAKVGLGLGTAEKSPMGKALAQAVHEYLHGRVPEAGSPARRFDPSRDTIVLCTDASAPESVRMHLAKALRRVASLPAGSPLTNELSKREEGAMRVALAHARRLWSLERGTEPSDEELRGFFKALHILTLDLENGRKDQQSALSTLQRGLTDPSQRLSAWEVLVREGHAASESRQWRDRAALVLALSQHGIGATLPNRYAWDIEVIRARSIINLHTLQLEAQLPVDGGLYISRSVAMELCELTDRSHVLIVGEAGSGKSGVVQEFATKRKDDQEVVVLRAADVVGANRIQTNQPLLDVLGAWAGSPGLLVIDGVDALRGTEDRDALSATVSALDGTRWQVVATARSYDARNSRRLQRAFAGGPVSRDAVRVDSQLATVRHLLVSEFDEEDLDRELVDPMPLASLFAKASPDLRRLLRIPFNLRLAAELVDGSTSAQQDDLLQVRSRVELLDRYWDSRVREEDRRSREALLERLASSMLTGRRLEVAEKEPTVLGTDSAALEGLLSQGVLRRLDGPIPGVGGALSFAHNILFDYAVAIHVLYDALESDGLVEKLDSDPTLPLIARPSFDLLVDMLWQARTGDEFWPRVLAVAGSGHVLASLAIASRVVNLVHDPNDLRELSTRGPLTPNTGELSSRQRLAGQVICAFRARAVLPRPANAVPALAQLAILLADHAKASYADAALATDLILALQDRVPITSENVESAGAVERAATVAALLDAARSEPIRMENLAGLLSRQLQYFVGISAEVRDAVQRLLEDDVALTQWGGTVLTWFPDMVVSALAPAPQLARSLATASLSFEETRNEDIGLGFSAIMPLRESRMQQARLAAYRLGEVFAQISSTDIVTATEIVSDAYGDATSANDNPQWPMVAHGTAGWLEHGYGLGYSPHNDVENKMLTALANALSASEDPETQAVVRQLVSTIHDGGVWAGLMQSPEHPAGLGRALLPAFESGTLLAHPDTCMQAATLLKAVAHEGAVPHEQLEDVVRRALQLVDQNHLSAHLKDVLVGCLAQDSISDETLFAHRERLGEIPPQIPPPRPTIAEVQPWTPIDRLREQDITLDPGVETAFEGLHDLLAQSQDEQSATPEGIAALSDAFVAANEIVESGFRVPTSLRYLVVDAARRLARARVIGPDTSSGLVVLKVLVDAADDSYSGAFLS